MISSISGSSYNSIYMQQNQRTKVDTNEDDALDINELKNFSTKIKEDKGTSFDAQEVMEKYDTNEDGLIDKSEGASLKEDNAFNMPSPENTQPEMMFNSNQRQVLMNMQTNNSVSQETSATSNTSSTISSSTSSASSLVESLSDSSEYSAADIAKYDTNGDGEIDSTEEAAMKQDKLKESLQETNSTEEESTEAEVYYLKQKAINAYSQQQNLLDESSESNKQLFDKVS